MCIVFFFFKQKTAYEMRISDWSSDVCSSDLVTAKEAKRLESGEAIDTGPKVPRPEISGTMQTYIDLHRHAAVREALTGHPKVALRLMVAHAIVGSYLSRVKPEPQTCRKIGRPHVLPPFPNSHLVCRLLLVKKKHT